MALPEGVFGLLYGEEDEVQEIDEAECGSTLRAGSSTASVISMAESSSTLVSLALDVAAEPESDPYEPFIFI